MSQPDRKGKKTLRVEQALKEKEMGNTYFKNGNYSKAIEHYGKAVELDPKEAVFVINRAMAHLKLKNWVEAEIDCTQGLILHPNNPKALWRRGIARRETGKLEESKKGSDVLKLEPNNKEIQDEYSKVLDIIKSNELSSDSIEITGERRRLTIEETDFDENEHIIESARKDLKSKLAVNELDNKELPIKSTTYTRPNMKVPRAMFEFERDWARYQGNNEDLYHYIKIIPPASYPTLLSDFLEVDYLSQFIFILRDFFLVRDSADDVFEILYNLNRTERFKMVLMFLGEEDKKANHNQKLTKATLQEVLDLAKVYKIQL
ncbi:5341_t:CDS:2 [Diversispora eburnea]|uniref:RNA polymerase II-associated protein 3 n=1 Tax=Diversispora eburnea TaxID=1213867 RepID=A0A9N8UYH7_9GLOM|nr:5341_t:CDS:2 [Diversispora eburnea]